MDTLFGKEFRYVNGNLMKENSDNLLDQYFTNRELAKSLYQKTYDFIIKYETNIDDYIWIEPCVGEGCFFDLLPENKKLGVDISPLRNDIIKSDYLKFNLPNKKLIVIGNPPFGHRGVMALNFINHSQKAEYVCFILPMFFESKGKGSIKYRVRGFNLIYSEILPKNSFYVPTTQKTVDVKCVFQIWSKNHKHENEEFSWYNNRHKEPFGDILKVYTVSLAKKRECGKKWIFDRKADFYISSTFHNKISIVYSFDEVKYKSGVAIVFTTENETIKNTVKQILETTEWKKYASLATNSCYHIGKSNIFQVLQDNADIFTNQKQQILC
ncbi:MAG: SAM-dependent methyltransferase [Bacteroidetes bacterium CG23_combo_of_CG06-09_8_20_14_all_32_9]|nr:MAG: SAM-dependent methyltransferase [Bacteroidetes bacterium CG23_combo_of_CG06-09_8_20_14_all_32_9]